MRVKEHMREVKFRAWDKDEKKMYKVYALDFDDRGKIVTAHIGNRKVYPHPDIGDQIEFMQYIGLKDKNGKEIFEGDIVRCASSRQCPPVVAWYKEVPSTGLGGMPGFYLKGLNEGYVWMEKEELIGNIYENPELLK